MRRSDWMKRLQDVVTAAKGEPFAWGHNDCVMFAARCVDAMTDGSHGEALRASFIYADETSGMALIAGGGGLGPLMTGYLGAPMPNPKMAAPGDVVLLAIGDTELVAIVVGHGVVSTGPKGLVTLPRRSIRQAWSV